MLQAVELLGWTLVHFLWQASAVWLLFTLCVRLAADQPANVRYLLGISSLAALAALPVLTFVVLSVQTPGLPGAGVREVVGAWSTLELSAMMPLAVVAWGGGVAYRAWHVMRDLLRVGAITRVGCRPMPAEWQTLVDNMSAALAISRPVTIMESMLVQVPAAVGWLRPVVLIPSSALLGLTREQLELIIAHELAHIRRFDYAVNLAQVALETLFFFHPAVLSISRQVRREREVCCDEMVIARGGNRYQYAQALTLLEDGRGLPAGCRTAMAANGGQLLGRIERLACDVRARRHNLVGSVAAFATGVAAIGSAAVIALSGAPSDVGPSLRSSALPLIAVARAEAVNTEPTPQLRELVRVRTTPVVAVAPTPAAPAPERPLAPPATRVALDVLTPVPVRSPAAQLASLAAPVAAELPVTSVSAPRLSTATVAVAPAVVEHDTSASELENAAAALLSRKPVHTLPPANADSTRRGIRQLYALSDSDGGDLIYRVDPRYPNSARTRGVEGTVTVDFAVNELGSVEDIQIVSQGVTSGFRRSVKQAVALWKYSPLRRDGLPVTYRQTQSFTFRVLTPFRVAQGHSCIAHSNDTWACRSLEGSLN
ncbi:MAG: M56 family metallopeptidase [Pseudomonadota bacterium]